MSPGSAPFRGVCLSESVAGLEPDLVAGEIRDIECEQCAVVEFPGITLGENEWLGGIAVIVYAAEIYAAVQRVSSSARKQNPMGVGAPVMEALVIFGIRPFDRMAFPIRQIHEPQVGFIVVDREIAEV